MSAFLVAKRHVDVLVSLALDGPRDHAHRWDPPSWPVREMDDRRRRRCRQADHASADAIGLMLWAENAASLEARYPGRAMCDTSLVAAYRFAPPRRRPTAVEGLKAIACYEYQSCEHDGWAGSEARRFCEALRWSLISALPGYRDAPWEWSDDDGAPSPHARRRA